MLFITVNFFAFEGQKRTIFFWQIFVDSLWSGCVPVLLADVVGVEAEGRADQPPAQLTRVNLRPESGEGLDYGTCY